VVDLTWSLCPYCAYDGTNGVLQVYHGAQDETGTREASRHRDSEPLIRANR
jgi:hypothetical protein